MGKVSAASLRFLARSLLALLLLFWAAGQLVWFGYLLADPPAAFLPDTPLGRLECASWLLGSALATLAVAAIVATVTPVPWHLVSLIAVAGWLALPLRSAWGAWSALGTFSFDRLCDPLSLSWLVVRGWFALALLALGAGLVGRGR